MKVELLKNKQTSIIEKIIINKGIKNQLSVLPFNLTHDQTMVELDKYDLKWHEIIMSFSSETNLLDIRGKLYSEFNNREVDYLITLLAQVHNKYFVSQKGRETEAWFFNYYIWTMFYLLTKELRTKSKGKTEIRVVDPMIMLFADGIENLKKFEIFWDYKKTKELSDVIWYHGLHDSYQKLHNVFSKHQYNNEIINLEIFKKEVMKLHNVDDLALKFWNAKKVMIKELLVDLIKEKIHYS